MLLSAAAMAAATMKPFFVTSFGNVLLNMQSDSASTSTGSTGLDYATMLASCCCCCWWFLLPQAVGGALARWRRDVTLPTLQAQRARARANTALSECNYFHVADRDEVRCMATQWGISPPLCLAHALAGIICKQRKVAGKHDLIVTHIDSVHSGTSMRFYCLTQNICKAMFVPLSLAIPLSQFPQKHDGIVMLPTFNSPSRARGPSSSPIIQNVQLFSNEGFTPIAFTM